jgi:hypothetical protein
MLAAIHSPYKLISMPKDTYIPQGYIIINPHSSLWSYCTIPIRAAKVSAGK